MFTRWTEHLKTDKEKEAFKYDLKSAKRVLERLGDIIEEDRGSLDRSEMNPKAYDQASWAYHQAHKNGLRQYMYQVQTLIDLDQQKE